MKNKISNIEHAGKLIKVLKRKIFKIAVEGSDGKKLDIYAQEFIKKNNAHASFLNYKGFPNSICVSINEQLIHGIPNKRNFRNGDLVSIDLGININGYHADAAFTKIIGSGCTTKQKRKLLQVTKNALTSVVKIIKPGIDTGTIGYFIEKYAKDNNLFVIKNYCGHGIGKNLHEEPQILNFGKKGEGTKLYAGMTICIEPMFQICCSKTKVLADGWTVVSKDSCLNAHFEHTILVTKTGAKVLT